MPHIQVTLDEETYGIVTQIAAHEGISFEEFGRQAFEARVRHRYFGLASAEPSDDSARMGKEELRKQVRSAWMQRQVNRGEKETAT